MLLTAHAVWGAGIGAVTGNIYVTAIAAPASHLLLDSFPHTDLAHLHKPGPDGELSDELAGWVPYVIVADVVMSILVVAWTAWLCNYPVPVIIGGIMGVFPDFQYAPGFGTWLVRQRWYSWYKWLHEPGHIHFPLLYWQKWWGFHTQAMAVAGGILFINRCVC